MIKIKTIISIVLLLYCGSYIFASTIPSRSSFIHYPTVLIAPQQADNTNLPLTVQAPDKNPFLQEKFKPLANDQVTMQQQKAPQHPMREKLTTVKITVKTTVIPIADCFSLCCYQPHLIQTYHTNLHRLAHYGLFNNLDLCHQIIDTFNTQDIIVKQTDAILNTNDYELFHPETNDLIISITFNSNDIQQIYTIAKEILEAKDENRPEKSISGI